MEKPQIDPQLMHCVELFAGTKYHFKIRKVGENIYIVDFKENELFTQFPPKVKSFSVSINMETARLFYDGPSAFIFDQFNKVSDRYAR